MSIFPRKLLWPCWSAVTVIDRNQLALYLHIPFCRQKCSYCAFYSKIPEPDTVRHFLNRLSGELKFRAGDWQKPVTSIYFGGGTPSLLSPAALEKILQVIEENYRLAPDPEITLEVNPGDLQSEAVLEGWQEIGLNRISLGVQSLQQDELNLLGRSHSVSQARRSLTILAKTEFIYNVDLISALPGQQAEDHLQNLAEILQYRPRHISCYNLQLEPETPLADRMKKGLLPEISEDEDARGYQQTRQQLEKKSYQHYEISNFALPGFKCRHNLAYWEFRPYAGFGPAACSFNLRERRKNRASLRDYLADSPRQPGVPHEKSRLDQQELKAEYLLMGLRLLQGIDRRDFHSFFHQSLADCYSREIAGLKEEGFLAESGNKIFLTDQGIMLGNQVFQAFL